MSWRTSRLLLQLVVLLALSVPVAASIGGLLLGPHLIPSQPHVSRDLDSHFRYLSGIFLGVALLFLSAVPDIESKTARFRLASFLIVMGGLGRLGSFLVTGVPSLPHVTGLALELGLVPLLVLWQASLARGARADSVPAKTGGTSCASPSRSHSSSSP